MFHILGSGLDRPEQPAEQAGQGVELGFGLADPRRPGAWQGVYGTGIPVARAVGPLLLAFLVVGRRGPGWLVLGGVLPAAALAVPPAPGWAGRTRTPALATTPA